MIKFKSRVFLAISIIFVALLGVVFTTQNKNISAQEYASEWQLSEGKSFQVISGNLGTNTNGSPYTVLSGEQSAFFITYSIMPSNPADPDLIEAGKFALKI